MSLFSYYPELCKVFTQEQISENDGNLRISASSPIFDLQLFIDQWDGNITISLSKKQQEKPSLLLRIKAITAIKSNADGAVIYFYNQSNLIISLTIKPSILLHVTEKFLSPSYEGASQQSADVHVELEEFFDENEDDEDEYEEDLANSINFQGSPSYRTFIPNLLKENRTFKA